MIDSNGNMMWTQMEMTYKEPANRKIMFIEKFKKKLNIVFSRYKSSIIDNDVPLLE